MFTTLKIKHKKKKLLKNLWVKEEITKKQDGEHIYT